MHFSAFVHRFSPVSTHSFIQLASGVVFRRIVYFVELTVPWEDAIGVAHERKKHTDTQSWQPRQRSVVRKLKSSQLEVSCRVFVTVT